VTVQSRRRLTHEFTYLTSRCHDARLEASALNDDIAVCIVRVSFHVVNDFCWFFRR
jgi:hypothetical protein